MYKVSYWVAFLFLMLTACKDKAEALKPEQAPTPIKDPLPDLIFTNLLSAANNIASPIIIDRLIGLIDASPAGASVHICIFGFDHAGIIDALQRASDRGVNLYLMLDLSREETQAQNPPTINKINSFIKSNSEVLVVTSDAGASSINHNKFALFSEVITDQGKQEKVVFPTSHNFTLADSKKIQDAVVLPHAGLYGAYLKYWQEMKGRAVKGMKQYYYEEYHDPATGTTAFFFPKRRNGTAYGDDTVIELLNGITEPATATIRVGMSDWTVARLNVVNKLAELLAKGASVEVVAKNKADAEMLSGLQKLEQKGAFVKIFNLEYANQPKINIHAKFILIKGKWQGEESNLIFTGSHNFTGNALRNNNEVSLLLKNQQAFFNTYMKYFDEMKKLPGVR